jgi:hypothetical protein
MDQGLLNVFGAAAFVVGWLCIVFYYVITWSTAMAR